MSPEAIAEHIHEINRQCCAAIGDPVKGPWSELTEQQRQGVIGGVRKVQQNPDLTAAQAHDDWIATMAQQGYKLGERIDHDAKTHTDMVPFDQMAPTSKFKAANFRAIVGRLSAV